MPCRAENYYIEGHPTYYGIAEKLPILSVFYQNLFEITDYTRNGIFFAPVFLVMGGMAAEEAASAQSEYAAAASYSITNDSRTISQNVNFYSNTPTPAESYRAVRQAGKELAGL